MRRQFYGMKRANGDWFALEVGGQNRVPVFRTHAGAWRARAGNPELMLFRPAPVDEGALEELATADGGSPAAFWLVDEDEPAATLAHGRPLGFEQLATLEGASRLPAAVTFKRRPVSGTTSVRSPRLRKSPCNLTVVQGDERLWISTG